MAGSDQETYNKQIAGWLLVCATVILGMIILGGVTRLTDSGLSMVEWKPLLGVIPPLTDESWLESFRKYQQFPEYQKINRGMSLEEFKAIYYFEYAHRVLGRLIGVLFLLPFLFFYFTGRLPVKLTPKLLLLFLMGGFQGLLGWFMVKSGLVDKPHVSQYRLTAHLGTAVLIYAYMLWLAWGLMGRSDNAPVALHPGLRRFSYLITGLLFVMILSGGLVAGTHAGLAYNNWPLMGPSFFPPGLYGTQPAWLAALEDIGTIQFNHRMLAYLLLVLIFIFAWKALRAGAAGGLRIGILLMVGLLVLQVSLGISTLLYLVPVPLAAAHQGVAICLLTSALYVSHRMAHRSVVKQWRYGITAAS
jgi:cytochrome c oxidase assembly protein subunit 15